MAGLSSLTDLLDTFRKTAVSGREKGTYFERLVKAYLLHEPFYADLYGGQVWLWEEWRAVAGKKELGDVGPDAGIDLVAETATGELHAIQAKFYAEDATLTLDNFATFLAATGKKTFSRGLIFLTATKSTVNLKKAMEGREHPISLITLQELEASQIDWSKFGKGVRDSITLRPKKKLMPHQIDAVQNVMKGFKEAERGKLIMACGSGKTFTSLKIAEKTVGAGGRVLFLVPSLALLSQALTEWSQDAETPLHSFAVCSDTDVGKKKSDDDFQMLVHELQYPATTDAKRLGKELEARHDKKHMTVVFSTYQSISVIHEAQSRHRVPGFDLVICDEAHRTTGAKFVDADESEFVKVHDNKTVMADRRLYMTATPRIYGDIAKEKADKEGFELFSMNNEKWFGKDFHVITFSEAVNRGLLVDYKVIVLAVQEEHISRRLQNLLAGEDNQLKMDDAAKIVGCWKALSKIGLTEDVNGDNNPMKRAVAFCQVIEIQKGAKTHKVSSKNIAAMFQAVVEEYQKNTTDEELPDLACETQHVDGSMNASEKDAKLAWLKADPKKNVCRILSNVRCLSEGVDVPTLDAVLFLTPRDSQVDVVQSVGRVMRKAPGKNRGYVILPVVIPAGVEPHKALDDNKSYKVVWQVLQALRSHDDRFDAMVNKLELTGNDPRKMEVIAVTDSVPQKKDRTAKGKSNDAAGRSQFTIGTDVKKPSKDDQGKLQFEIGEIERAIYAKIVQKVGNRQHWEDWAGDIAKIARTHIARIKGIIEDQKYKKERRAFDAFAKELRDDLNDSITDDEIVEMLAQHLITKPVFDALFEGYSFASKNPMSQVMQKILDVLGEHRLEKEADTLAKFYASVKMRAEGIDNAAGKQKIVVELYDKFFRNAFPKMTERLGIVYTPVEVVDFILHSVAHVLKAEFGQTLGSKGVHILDPFTGTGTFVTRLMQSGLIEPKELPPKYKHEIHANEIVLLAYYIAAINIEAVYHSITGGQYQPFEGICLTDTFQMYEKEDLVDALLVDNSLRRRRQKKLDIRVILGNPPYSIGQTSQNDNNQNVGYPLLDALIENTYAKRSQAALSKGLYDSYIRAIRWASERIGNAGVIGFITNGGFIEKPAMDGLRKCLAEEFSSIHVLNLRGDIRKNMLSKGRAKEGSNIFGSGSMAGIAVSILVKNPNNGQHARIHYHDIGDDLSREEKLERLTAYGSIAGINAASAWLPVAPDAHGDWLKQRDDSFSEFIALGDKKGNHPKLFENFSLGVVTNRDAWCYNPSKAAVTSNMTRMISSYNSEVDRFVEALGAIPKKDRDGMVDAFIDTNPTKISWTRALKKELSKSQRFSFDAACLTHSLYRPFNKQWLYFNRRLNEMVLQMPRIFPDSASKNLVICVAGVGARAGFSTIIADRIPSLDTIEKGQCFPLFLYDDPTEEPVGGPSQSGLFTTNEVGSNTRRRRDALTDEGLAHFQASYPGEALSKEDVFFYVYGLLHSPDYCARFADNLGKELPHIPCVKAAAGFWAFSRAGRALAELHLNYENAPMYSGAKIELGDKRLTDSDYRVERMRFGKKGKDKDLTTVIYNNRIAVSGIPLEAYEYVVNGKAAIDWVMERQCVKTDKDSGIVSDANDWAIGTMQNPRYPLELLLRVVTVSIETMKIVRALPALDI